MIEAFRRMPHERLVVVGTGTELEKYIGLASDNVRFTGYLNCVSLNEVMNHAKAVIVASQWYEPFGMVVVEAFAKRIPVIAGDLGNVGMMVDEKITGRKFEYDSIESLIDAIRDYDEDEYEQMGDSALKVYKQRYSEKLNYEDFMDIYSNICLESGNVDG